MANVMFKRGLQKNLPKEAQDGVFYLTTDSNRLYIGNNKEMSLLNQTVQIVANVSTLPTNPEINDFYYCEEENILAVWNGGSEWIQINKDTNDIVKISKIEQGEGYKDGDDLVYPLTISQVKTSKNGVEDNQFEGDIEFEIRISKSNLEEVIFKPANVGLKQDVSNNTITISTDGDGSDKNSSVSIVAGDNISIVAEDGKAKISATDTKYTLSTGKSTNSGSLILKSQDSGQTNEVKFNSGSNLTVSSDENGITYSHASIETKPVSEVIEDFEFGGSITAVKAIKTNNGHITEITTETVTIPTLPEDVHIDTIINEKDAQGNLVPDWKVQIKETVNGETFDINFSADAAALEETLRTAISDGLAAANTALVYKGGIEDPTKLPTDSVEVGDVYLLMKASGDYKVGDLFIATAGDGATVDNGVINGSVAWTYVPSGDELNTDTYFKGDVEFDAANNQVSFEVKAANTKDGQEVVVEGNETLVLKGGTDINISSDSGAAKISHEEYTTTTDAKSAESKTEFTAITGITTRNGHITQIDKETFNILGYELTGSGNAINLKTEDNANVGSIKISGNDWIDATVENNELKVEHTNTEGSGKEVGADNSTTSLAANGKFKIISKVGYDDAGHITKVKTQELTLPEDSDTTYELFVGSTNETKIGTEEVFNPYIVLKDINGAINSMQLFSESLSIKGKIDNDQEKISVDLVWGSFND